jgi:hypothetical protein
LLGIENFTPGSGKMKKSKGFLPKKNWSHCIACQDLKPIALAFFLFLLARVLRTAD